MADKYNPVGWFEIPVRNLEQAKAFYEHLFGYTLEVRDFETFKMAWFPMISDAKGATGSLVSVDETFAPGQGTVVYFTAPDINAHLARAKENGGTIVMEKTDIGEFGYMAMVKDTEGNTIGLHSMTG